MLAKLYLQFVLASMLGVGTDEGYATIYGTPGDKHAQGLMACYKRPVPQDEPLCAHRWVPCNTKIIVMNRGTVSVCRVADRGPYGVDRSDRWRGILDLTPGAARNARLNGKDYIRIIYKFPQPGAKLYGDTRYLWPPRRSGPSM